MLFIVLFSSLLGFDSDFFLVYVYVGCWVWMYHDVVVRWGFVFLFLLAFEFWWSVVYLCSACFARDFMCFVGLVVGLFDFRFCID